MKISHLDLHMLMCEEADDDMGPVLLMDPDRASGLMPKRCWAADAPARAEAALPVHWFGVPFVGSWAITTFSRFL